MTSFIDSFSSIQKCMSKNVDNNARLFRNIDKNK